MDVLNIEIFGKIIFGVDAENWLKLCKGKKKEWILKYTNQKNEALIEEFIKNPRISKDCKCLDCGKNATITNGIPKETTASVEPADNSGNNRKDSAKRQSSTKRTKNK